MARRAKQAGDVVKTSITLPRDLWKSAHVRALDESRDLQDVMTSALEAYLKTPLKSREGGKR
jgi:post-segregation antitoxin (ccd killing protein)